MTRSIRSRVAAGILATGAATAFALAGASAANAGPPASTPLAPGQGTCTASEYASYQVRGDGWATAQGAKFKLLYNGQVVTSTPNRANAWAAEFRSAFGNFPGPGYYSVCAQNTGTANTIATLQIRTDGRF
jgi:hypothetical protein